MKTFLKHGVPWLTAAGLLWQCYNRTIELKMEREKLWKAHNGMEFYEKAYREELNK